MEYRIEYAEGKCCNFAHSRKGLAEWLKLLKDGGEAISDIRKLYRNGTSESVMEKYGRYTGRPQAADGKTRPSHGGKRHGENCT